MMLLDFDVAMGNIDQYSHPSSPMAILLQLAYPHSEKCFTWSKIFTYLSKIVLLMIYLWFTYNY